MAVFASLLRSERCVLVCTGLGELVRSGLLTGQVLLGQDDITDFGP